MATVNDALALASKIAEQSSSIGPAPIPDASIEHLNKEIRNPQQLEKILIILQRDALAHLDQSPRQALGLSRVAYHLARADLGLQAETGLTYAIALNRLGEFGQALELSNSAAVEFTKRGNSEQAARCHLQAAWAQTFLGQLKAAMDNMERARKFDSSRLVTAESDRIEGRILRAHGDYARSEACFKSAHAIFGSTGMMLQAARCQSELADNISNDPLVSISRLNDLSQLFKSNGCYFDVAMCDWLSAIHLTAMHQYSGAVESLEHALQVFSKLQTGFYIGCCDKQFGVIYRHINRYGDSLEACHRARNYFFSHHVPAEVSACDVNLGNTYYALNQYDEALRFYQEAADLILLDYRPVRTALIYDNMGLVYEKQGFFAKSIDLHQRALWIFAEEGLDGMVANALTNLAAACRQLGQHTEAINYFNRARAIFEQQKLATFVAECDLGLGEIYSVRGQTKDAIDHLQQARDAYLENRAESFVALCDRLLAKLIGESGDPVSALALIEQSRATFLQQQQIVDVALCDLAEGELHLAGNNFKLAKEAFQRAQIALSSGLDDHAWRADYGLARTAWSTSDRAVALDYYFKAVRRITQSRSTLVTEQLSNDYFTSRQSIYEAGLGAAIELNAMDSVLEIIESVKARIMLTLVQNPEWKSRRDESDAYVRDLIKREKELRYRLDELRGHMAVRVPKDVNEIVRSNAVATESALAFNELSSASDMYESVVSRLRLASSGLAGVSSLAPFALYEFRQSVNGAIGTNWAALDYHLVDGKLTLALIKPDELDVIQTNLSSYDNKVLSECTAIDHQSRLRIYRGMRPSESDGLPNTGYLRHLYQLLIPRGLDAETVIIVPHGPLHSLPFQALINENGFMIEKHTLFYAPSLQILQKLFSHPVANFSLVPLAMGLSDFEGRMPELPWANAEIEKILAVFNRPEHIYWQDQATRQKLFELNDSGELQKFNVLHFATHSVLDSLAPHRSSVFLHDAALTTLDILGLKIDARLVTLSACESSVGQRSSGDELIGLAHAFFYAGARALLATQWRVEDASMCELITHFYGSLALGENAAQALRRAQVAMIRKGYAPFQWAAAVLIGRP